MILPPWDPKASEIAQCRLLGALIECQKPRVVVESGTYRGHAALFMARACRRNGVGHVWTADPDDHGVVQSAENNALGDWLTYHQGDFEEMLPDAVDFAYIDGSGPGTGGAALRKLHFQAVLERLRPGGMVLVDDTGSFDWSDGEKGASVHEIREKCVNFGFLRGVSLYLEP